MATDPPQRFCSAADRNKGPILEVLKQFFTEAGCILEIGSGTGQHAVYFAANLPHITWQATELPSELDGIEAWRREAALANLPPPLELDVHRDPWPVTRADGAFSANTAHISPGGALSLYSVDSRE